MAANKTPLILLALAAAGLALFAGGDAKADEKPQPAPPPPPPPTPSPSLPVPAVAIEPAADCVRTKAGDRDKPGTTDGPVRRWQRCLIAAGCLAPGEDDGVHLQITEKASDNFAAKTCTTPLKTAKGGAPPDRVYGLVLGGALKRAKLGGGTAKASAAIVAELKAGAQDLADKAQPAGSEDGLYAVGSTLQDQVSDPRTHATFQITGKSYGGGNV